tara:strand:+ start:5654 stop:5848 length:195 start_codon:yes stop_codon:yes gene_type:complete
MKKKTKRFFEDKTHKRATRSTERKESKSQRHHTKDILHNLSSGSLDKDREYDMMDELEDTQGNN